MFTVLAPIYFVFCFLSLFLSFAYICIYSLCLLSSLPPHTQCCSLFLFLHQSLFLHSLTHSLIISQLRKYWEHFNQLENLVSETFIWMTASANQRLFMCSTQCSSRVWLGFLANAPIFTTLSHLPNKLENCPGAAVHKKARQIQLS